MINENKETLYKFSDRSKKILSQCDTRLQTLAARLIDVIDFAVIEGYRDDMKQNEYFDLGLSKARAGESKHNTKPSKAVHFAPYPIDWKNRERFTYLAGIAVGMAKELGIKIRWGGDWDSDGELTDNGFDDLCHFEIVE